jgi:hypothetical protein
MDGKMEVDHRPIMEYLFLSQCRLFKQSVIFDEYEFFCVTAPYIFGVNYDYWVHNNKKRRTLDNIGCLSFWVPFITHSLRKVINSETKKLETINKT